MNCLPTSLTSPWVWRDWLSLASDACWSSRLCCPRWLSGPMGRQAGFTEAPCVCSLIQLEAFLSRLCCTCEASYRVLRWENPSVSSQWVPPLPLPWRNGGLGPSKASCFERAPAPWLRGWEPSGLLCADLHIGLWAQMHCFCLDTSFRCGKNILIIDM